MIKIFYDHQKFSTQKYGGISRYFASLIDDIKHQDEFEYILGVLYSDNQYIKNEPLHFQNSIAQKLMKFRDGQYKYLLNSKYCEYLLKNNKFDIFHPTYYDPYFLGKLKRKLVTTVHDMTYERLPEYFWSGDQLTLQKRISMENADKIIAISETTKNDILSLTDIKEERIEVIYHGIDLDTPPIYQEIKGLPDQYLLFVGDRSGYKNFYLFMNAYKIISQKDPDIKVIITGGGGLGTGEVEFLKRLQLDSLVTHINASDSELNYLYNKALLFVYPSLYEGFGLPILEAFKARCPILLSDISCFREVANDSAAFFDPHSLVDLSNMLEKLIYNKQSRMNLVTKGEEKLLKYSLTESMQRTLNLYKELL